MSHERWPGFHPPHSCGEVGWPRPRQRVIIGGVPLHPARPCWPPPEQPCSTSTWEAGQSRLLRCLGVTRHLVHCLYPKSSHSSGRSASSLPPRLPGWYARHPCCRRHSLPPADRASPVVHAAARAPFPTPLNLPFQVLGFGSQTSKWSMGHRGSDTTKARSTVVLPWPRSARTNTVDDQAGRLLNWLNPFALRNGKPQAA